MQINRINIYSNYHKTNQNRIQFSNPNFEGISIKAKKPKFKTQHIENLYNKAYKYFNMVGLYGKLSSPRLIEVDGIKYGIDCNRKNPKQQHLVIKDKLNTIEDWNTLQEGQSVIEFNFNEAGKLENGSFTKTEANGYCRNAFFRREGKSHRQMRIEGIEYRPTRNNDTIWSSVPELSYFGVDQDIDVIEKFKDIKLSELFFEFTKAYREILPATKE